MKGYNGFSPQQRTRALRWLRQEEAAGRRRRPTRCEACGQTRGVVDSHSEDYSDPFGPHIGRFALCFRCHMIVHCRFSSPASFEVYEEALREGVRFPAMTRRDFQRFRREHLHYQYPFRGDELERLPPHTRHSPPDVDLLGDIKAGVFRPKESCPRS